MRDGTADSSTSQFGAAAAIGRLAGFDAATLVNAFGAVLGQLSGTMQAHAEGSPMLGMQVGFGARNAIVACAPNFTDVHLISTAMADRLVEVLGPARGIGARATIGVHSEPITFLSGRLPLLSAHRSTAWRNGYS